MKNVFLTALASLVGSISAVGVVGQAEGFAAGVTGGGSATPQYPKDINELTKWLTDATPRVIVLDKTFDYTTSEGTVTGTACANWGTGAKCQRILLDKCDAGVTKETVTYNKAAKTPIKVASNKSIIGIGSKGIIKGKGLSFASKNVIVQNIQVSDLNHKYVWGGDALSFSGADLIWIDHVTVSTKVFQFLSVMILIACSRFTDRSSRPTALRLWFRPQHPRYSFQQLHQRRI